MKKLTLILLALTTALACTPKPKNHVADWKLVGLLPIPAGFTESIGVSGAFSGFIGDKLIIAGGANFPYAPVIEGGAKEFYHDIFVFDINSDNTLSHVGSGQLPKKLATGHTVSVGDSLYFIGGENKDGDSATIYSITLNENTPLVTEVATLPFTFAAGAAVVKDNVLYLAGGRQNKKSSNKLHTFNLNTKESISLADIPGEPRVQMPYLLANNKFYIFNGLGSLTLVDSYAYDLDNNTWSALANSSLENIPYTVGGGAAVPLSADEILILGGVNKQVFDDAITQLGSLKGAELEAFRQDYFNRSPEQFNFSTNQMVYNTTKNQWYSVGTIPFYGGAGPFPVLVKDGMVWHVSGEIKAGVRTPEVHAGLISQKK